MTIEELQYLERDSFQKEFNELVEKHRPAMDALKMGLSVSGDITRWHYKKQEYAINSSVNFDVKTTKEWYD